MRPRAKTAPLKIMVVGIPNVGKSTLINQIAGRKGAKAENRPGVTRGKQWVNVDGGLLLLDTPGILWPKFEDPEVGLHLAYTGAVKDDILDAEELAVRLMELLWARYPRALEDRYKLEALPENRGLRPSGGSRQEAGLPAGPRERLTQSAWPMCCWTNTAAASWAGLL